jgi:ribosomal protein L11 methyltransferase
MQNRFTIQIELTPEQRAQIRQASGKELASLELTPDDWPPGLYRGGWPPDRAPVRIGRSLVITPAGATVEAGEGDRVIELESSETVGAAAFGTGAHASTRLALELLEACLQPGDRVLDLGTGSGILALAAARLGAREVLALDIDAAAVAAARRNVAANDLARVIQVREGSAEAADGAPYDLMVANLLAHVMRPLAPALARLVRPAGLLLVSGIVAARGPDVAAALYAEGFRLVEERPEGHWRALVLRRELATATPRRFRPPGP